ncbi:YIP1 family protein [Aestuariibius insulae]
MAWLIIWPLAFYGLAGLSHIAARMLGGRGNWFSARLALFWALLAATPAALLYGLTMGLIGPGPQASLTGFIWLLGLAWIWLSGLVEAETQEATI